MDKNSIIGLVVIGALLVGYMLLTKPSKSELAEAKRKQDSITQVRIEQDSLDKVQKDLLAQMEQDDLQNESSSNNVIASGVSTPAVVDTLTQEEKDLIESYALTSEYGSFSSFTIAFKSSSSTGVSFIGSYPRAPSLTSSFTLSS